MNTHEKYISPGQIIILFGAAGALYAGITGGGSGLSETLINAVLSAAATAAAAIPLCIFSAKNPNADMLGNISRKGIVLRIVCSVIAAVYFLGSAAYILEKFGEFACERIFPEGNIYLCITLTGIVCIYAAHTGTQAVSRMTTLISALFFISLVLLLIGGKDDFSLSPENIAPKEITLADIFVSGRMTGLFPVLAAGAVTASMLCSNAGKKIRCGVYGGLAAALTVSSGLFALTWAALGDFTLISEYPALDAAVFCGRKFSFSFHGIFYALWIIAAAALLSMLAACGGQALTALFPKIKYPGAIAAAAVLGIALIETLTASLSGNIFASPVFAVLLLIIFPLIAVKKPEARRLS